MDGGAAAVVLDNGSGFIKAGFAGDNEPHTVFPTVVGKHRNEVATNDVGTYVGKEALRRRNSLALIYPMEHGIITDWGGIEAVWHHTFYNELCVAPENQPVFLTEAFFNPKEDREKKTQIMFENFKIPAMYIGISGVMPLYVSGRTKGIAVESGDGVTQIIPIFEGYPLLSEMRRLDFGGRDITRYLMNNLVDKERSSAIRVERETANDIKEKLCYFALDFDQEIAAIDSSNSAATKYILPDGQPINLGSERIRCPEVIFKPYLMGLSAYGIHKSLYNAIGKCGEDLKRELYGNIVLAGGSTMITGMSARLQKELSELVQSTIPIKIVAPSARQYSVWIGSSILTSLSTFQPMWITKEEYEDAGPTIVHRKCY